jgi:hypothetical protein
MARDPQRVAELVLQLVEVEITQAAVLHLGHQEQRVVQTQLDVWGDLPARPLRLRLLSYLTILPILVTVV